MLWAVSLWAIFIVLLARTEPLAPAVVPLATWEQHCIQQAQQAIDVCGPIDARVLREETSAWAAYGCRDYWLNRRYKFCMANGP